ncbi:MAG: 7-cyano-7-deazaguanine synthase [Elusimicrobia bacterium]|nr:7-cyano-7-deazaguanine synthase [Elusimicrobiota bacterium]
MDSAVALWWALNTKRWSCRAICFDYGQRHKREIKNAFAIAKKANIPVDLIRFSLPWSGSSLTNEKVVLPHRSVEKIPHHIPSTYVPGRNTLFLSFALSLADQSEAEAIVIGANAIDYSGYPDCRDAYLKAFSKVARLGTRMGSEQGRAISIHAPLIHLTKAGIVKMGLSLGVPLEKTWSCYKGGQRPCGRCDSCVLRAKGFLEAGVPDLSLNR